MFKFNGGDGAVICDCCGKIIRTGQESGQFFDVCENCQKIPSVVDNFDLIADTLIFDDENTFYWIQVVKRRKDNPGMDNNYQTYKFYYIKSIDDLYSKKEDIVKLCKTFNARAVLWVNRRDKKELALPLAQLSLEYIQCKQWNALKDIYAHICGKHHKKGIMTKYIIDVDSKDPSLVNTYTEIVRKCQPKSEDPAEYILIPTLHGYHIICPGFNVKTFQQECVIHKVDIPDFHKDNPTLLYFNPA